MCLATVRMQAEPSGHSEVVLEKVQVIDIEDDVIRCENLFGETAEIKGTITRVDFGNSLVTVLRADVRLRGEKGND